MSGVKKQIDVFRNLPFRDMKIKFLHTRIRVADLDRSVAFYTKLGYQVGERKDSPSSQ
jgi:catechol-2,3-dioxygenase